MRSKKDNSRPLKSLPGRFSDVLSRVSINLDKALGQGDGSDLIKAAMVCRDCSNAGPCRTWIKSHEEGGGAEAPHFCRIQRFLKGAAPAVPKSRAKVKAKKAKSGRKPAPRRR